MLMDVVILLINIESLLKWIVFILKNPGSEKVSQKFVYLFYYDIFDYEKCFSSKATL